MERLNPQASMTYWKASILLLTSVVLTSWISKKCFQQSKLPRHHLLKISELLRRGIEHSIAASQSPTTRYRDTCKAKIYINLVSELLTPEQILDLSGIDIHELKHLITTHQVLEE
ncbi:FirrV-1-B32 [Feldmannia irregularis virus a]|uniref:FirrV-1-B32 n=1 Tax=Feldmannia irregularis virus a TaxID=231992 RepID=Q6XM04_9PHYC|nr:FirrV-1-B32 [Feldmannia irregularis virus a]AAR26907.1 FirrV-1-B32 [Feldmannia irregularis virus a]